MQKEELRKTTMSKIRVLPTLDPIQRLSGQAEPTPPVLSYGMGYGTHLPLRMPKGECSPLVILKCGPRHPRGKSQGHRKDRELILTSDTRFCKSIETQNAGNGEGGTTCSHARFLPPALPGCHTIFLGQNLLVWHFPPLH